MAIDPGRLFAPFELTGAPTVIAAVSGGSDSLALLLLLKRYLGAAAPEVQIVAVTVDHGLRPASRMEAQHVAEICRAIGVAHEIVQWSGVKPASGIAAAAREARYRLLAQAAARHGASVAVVGHTMDDQAETVAMRALRGGAGVPGAAAMAPATLYDDRIWLLRPLLGVRRADLRALLCHAGIQWIDDPTNDDPAYERVRRRRELRDDPAAIEHACETAARAAVLRIALSDQAARMIAACAESPCPGLFHLRIPEGDRPMFLHALRLLLATAGGMEHLPDAGRSSELLAGLTRPGARATLSRCLVHAGRDGLWIARESRDLPAPRTVSDCEPWDGRYRVKPDLHRSSAILAPLGSAMAAELAPSIRHAPPSLVRAALAALPGFWDGGDLIASPLSAAAGDAGPQFTPVIAPYARFLPCFDLAAAAALRALLGAPPLPSSPFRKHIE